MIRIRNELLWNESEAEGEGKEVKQASKKRVETVMGTGRRSILRLKVNNLSLSLSHNNVSWQDQFVYSLIRLFVCLYV